MEVIYLTEQGLKGLKKEWERTREKIKKITENRDRKEELDWLREREAELKNNLRNAKEIKIPPRNKRDIVNLGARVMVEVDGQTDEFDIVDSLEADPSFGKISNQSPVGKALLGKRVGEKVIVSTPFKTVYIIKKITYPLRL